MNKYLVLFGLLLGACGGSDSGKPPVCTALCVHRDNVIVRLVDDASGDPVKTSPAASGLFTVDGAASGGECVAPDASGDPACSNIGFELTIGDHEVVIRAAGYQPVTVDAQLAAADRSSCCAEAQSNIVDVTVRLKK